MRVKKVEMVIFSLGVWRVGGGGGDDLVLMFFTG